MLGTGILESQAWLRLLWEQTSDAVALSDAHGVVLAANAAYYRLYGYPPEEVLGRSFAIIFPSDYRATAEREYQTIFRGDQTPPVVQSTVKSKDGRDRVVEAHVSFVEVHGRREAMLSIIRDVTDELRARNDATDAQHELRALVFSLSHDIKSPLSVVKGHAQVLRRYVERHGQLPTVGRFVDGLMQIESSALRVAGLVDDLVEVATIQDGQSMPIHRSDVDLVALVRESVERHARLADQHHFVIDAEPESIRGNWDGSRLTRVLDNLLGNAIKYSPEGGPITVTVRLGNRPQPAMHPADRQESSVRQGVLLTVRDSGIGIATDDLPHVFDRFRRGANVPDAVVGSGIGLTSVAQIVQQHGGCVDIQSRAGSGTSARVWLPRGAADPIEGSR